MKAKTIEPPLYQTTYQLRGITSAEDDCGEGQYTSPVEERFYRWAEHEKCPMCSTDLELITSRGTSGDDADGAYLSADQYVRGCLSCGWWTYRFTRGSDITISDSVALGAIINCRDLRAWAPVPVLREYLARNPEYLSDSLDPIILEQVLRDVFSDFYHCEVRWTGRGQDGGYDLFHVVGDDLTLYQVKRRQRQITESVVPIRALLGVMQVERASAGIYVTTAEQFSAHAQDTATRVREQGVRLELINCGTLIDILKETLPRNPTPWKQLWEKHEPEYRNYERDIVDASHS